MTISIDTELRFESAEQRAGFARALQEAVLDVVARRASPHEDSTGSPAPERLVGVLTGA